MVINFSNIADSKYNLLWHISFNGIRDMVNNDEQYPIQLTCNFTSNQNMIHNAPIIDKGWQDHNMLCVCHIQWK